MPEFEVILNERRKIFLKIKCISMNKFHLGPPVERSLVTPMILTMLAFKK